MLYLIALVIGAIVGGFIVRNNMAKSLAALQKIEDAGKQAESKLK